MGRQGLCPKQSTQEWGVGERAGRGARNLSQCCQGHTSAVSQLWDSVLRALPLPGSQDL